MRFLLNTLLARLLVGSAVTLVLFTAVGLVAALVIDPLLEAPRWERNTHLVLIEALQLRQRAEAVTEAVTTLPPQRVADARAYQEGWRAFLEHNRKLIALVQDNPEQMARAQKILRLAEQVDRLV